MKNERFYCVDCPLEDPSVNLIKLGFHCQPPKRLWYQKSRSIVAISSVRKQLEFSSNKTRSLWFSVCTFAVRAQYGNIFRNWTLVSEREKGCIPDELTQLKEQLYFGEWKRKLFSFFSFSLPQYGYQFVLGHHLLEYSIDSQTALNIEHGHLEIASSFHPILGNGGGCFTHCFHFNSKMFILYENTPIENNKWFEIS